MSKPYKVFETARDYEDHIARRVRGRTAQLEEQVEFLRERAAEVEQLEGELARYRRAEQGPATPLHPEKPPPSVA